MPNNQNIYIGEITGVFGIKGELKVFSESDFTDYRFRVGAKIILDLRGKIQNATITSMRYHKNNILITINDYRDINLVSSLVGAKAFASKDDVPPLEEDEYAIDDLVGLEVISTDNESLGVVSDFIEVPQGEIMEVKNGNKKMLIPFVDEYIIEISDDKIVVKVLEIWR